MLNAQDVYDNTNASLMCFCKNLRNKIQAADPVLGANLKLTTFDSFASDEVLPEADCLGPANVTLTLNNQIVDVSVMFGFSLFGPDPDNRKLEKLCGYLFRELIPTHHVDYMDSEVARVLGKFVILDGVQTLPVVNGTRPSRFFMVELKSVFTVDY